MKLGGCIDPRPEDPTGVKPNGVRARLRLGPSPHESARNSELTSHLEQALRSVGPCGDRSGDLDDAHATVQPRTEIPALPLAEPAPRSATAVAATPPLTLEGDDRLPVRPPGPRRPLRWPWLAGAAAVAVLGTSAVLRSSRRAAPEAPRSPAIDVLPHGRPGDTTMVGEPATAAAPLPPARRPALIELRFEATPDGAVFTEGRSTELCRTPCAFDIDPADGGSTTRRGFVVRRAGYIDRPVVVDLTGAQRAFHVVLQPLPSRHTSGR